jgi:hypothetical protein
MFKEILVDPRQKELDKLQSREGVASIQNPMLRKVYQERQAEKKKIKNPKNVELNHSNMMNSSSHQLKKNSEKNFVKNASPEREVSPEGSPMRNEMPDLNGHEEDIISIILKKFNSKLNSKKISPSFFTQQIHVQPPEGLNATISAPLTPGGGWAPSIPNTTSNTISKTSLKDLTIRAKAGVQAGDIQKEAHMAFCLGQLNEE